MPHLSTDRLLLRAFQPADRPALRAITLDPEVMAMALSEHVLSDAEFESLLERMFARSDAHALGLGTIVERASGKVMGFGGLTRFEYLGGDAVEFGCALALEEWGRGYATEIAGACCRDALGRLGYARVLATANPANAASIRVVEKLGGTELMRLDVPERGLRIVYELQRGA